MNELDDLKSIWKNQSTGFDAKNTDEIARMLQGRSTSIVIKLKRSVWFELAFTIVSGIGLAIYGIYAQSGQLAWMVLTLSVIFAIYILYYVKKLKLLNRYDLNQGNLKTNLEHLVLGLSAYLSFYKRSYTILYPVFFLLGLFFGALDAGLDNFLQRFSQPSFLIWFILITTVFMVGIYRFTDWYLYKLYGNYLEKLKALLHELTAAQ